MRPLLALPVGAPSGDSSPPKSSVSDPEKGGIQLLPSEIFALISAAQKNLYSVCEIAMKMRTVFTAIRDPEALGVLLERFSPLIDATAKAELSNNPEQAFVEMSAICKVIRGMVQTELVHALEPSPVPDLYDSYQKKSPRHAHFQPEPQYAALAARVGAAREFMEDIVRKNGLAIEFASVELKNDIDLVKLAVADDSDALMVLPEAMRTNREVLRVASRSVRGEMRPLGFRDDAMLRAVVDHPEDRDMFGDPTVDMDFILELAAGRAGRGMAWNLLGDYRRRVISHNVLDAMTESKTLLMLYMSGNELDEGDEHFLDSSSEDWRLHTYIHGPRMIMERSRFPSTTCMIPEFVLSALALFKKHRSLPATTSARANYKYMDEQELVMPNDDPLYQVHHRLNDLRMMQIDREVEAQLFHGPWIAEYLKYPFGFSPWTLLMEFQPASLMGEGDDGVRSVFAQLATACVQLRELYPEPTTLYADEGGGPGIRVDANAFYLVNRNSFRTILQNWIRGLAHEQWGRLKQHAPSAVLLVKLVASLGHAAFLKPKNPPSLFYTFGYIMANTNRNWYREYTISPLQQDVANPHQWKNDAWRGVAPEDQALDFVDKRLLADAAFMTDLIEAVPEAIHFATNLELEIWESSSFRRAASKLVTARIGKAPSDKPLLFFLDPRLSAHLRSLADGVGG